MKAIIYTRPKYCPYCEKAKLLLNELGISYQEIIVENEEIKLSLFEKIGSVVKTVPQIFLTVNEKDQYIGGYNELELWAKGL